MILSQNIPLVREEVAKCGREVTLIAASKTQSAETIESFAALAPDFEFGENRASELVQKYDPAHVWHFIGQLQSNKAHEVVGKVRLIHSLDRHTLAKEIDRLAGKLGTAQGCLVEINMAGEMSKGGVSPLEARDFIHSLEQYKNIRVQGVMSVLPHLDDKVALEEQYDKLYRLFEDCKSIKTSNADIKYLSAGMSEDFRMALKHGSNMIRLGRFLFGERPKY